MNRLRLTTLLLSLNVGLLLAAVAGVAYVAATLLRQTADEQALARVAQAASGARNDIHRSGDDLQAKAQLLAERPTLSRLLLENDSLALLPFLNQFQQTGQLSGCAILRGGRLVAECGAALPWEALWAAHHQSPDFFFYRHGEAGPLVLGAWSAIPTVPGGSVTVALLLDEAYAQSLSAEIGLRTTLLAPDPATLTALQRQALTGGQTTSARLAQPDAYAAVTPLIEPDGSVAGLVQTELPATDIAHSLDQLRRTLLLLALGMGAAAAIGSLALGRWLGRPLQSLTKAAAHMGLGDLDTPIPSAGGMEIGTLAATLEDMRRRLLRLTADLRREQAESSAIVTGIVEGVFTVNRERRIAYMNPQAAAMLGIEVRDAVGKFCGDVLDPQGPNGERPCAEHCPIVHSRFRAGARAAEQLRLRSGQLRAVVITSAPPAPSGDLSSDGELRQVQVMRDETDLEAVRRLRDVVLTTLSHEFRTPLSAQLASLELLLDQLPDLSQEQLKELVVSLQRGTLRLTQLIDNLLESVRLEAGQYNLRRRPVPLDDVIEQALAFTQPLLDQREQTVAMELPHPLPPVSGDATRLTQVFVNLLANANKFAPAGSAIAIGGEVAPLTVSVWVEDHGPGLPPAAGQALFQRFVRSSSSAEEPEPAGVGLGLWIVKSIVERHGGRVEAHSSAGGTRMTVTLPRATETER